MPPDCCDNSPGFLWRKVSVICIDVLLPGMSLYVGSEGVLTGACSEALRSTSERVSERARKGFEARAVGLRSKCPIMVISFFTYVMSLCRRSSVISLAPCIEQASGEDKCDNSRYIAYRGRKAEGIV